MNGRFSLSMNGGHNHSLRLSKLKPKLLAVAGAGAVAVGAGVLHQRLNDESKRVERLKIPATVVEALAGALGEVTQIVVLYPLDTIKVRCQAMGMTAADVVKGLVKQGLSPTALLRQLYAGVLGAGLCSIAVGAVHYASYESSRRFLLQNMNSKSDQSASAAATTSAHGSAEQPASSNDKLRANVCAAVFAALVTALVESPVELFRHNQQAGVFQGSFIKEMAKTVKQEGPAGLYWGFLPHCFEAWPHDIGELLVVGAMKDMSVEGRQPSSPHHKLMQSMPDHVWDLTTGAASGIAAVMVSMPFDCIKTYMQTHGTDLTGKGFLGSAKLFIRTGQRMVAKNGAGCLYYGVVPRLLQQVPSAMMCWWTIHAVQRMLKPYTMA